MRAMRSRIPSRRVFGSWALAFAVATGGPAGCVTPGSGECAYLSCPDGQRCVQEELDDEPTCRSECKSSASCGDAEPVCDEALGLCRGCVTGEDQTCQKRSARTPRCVDGRCAACRSPVAGPGESADCQAPGQLDSPVCDRGSCRPCQRHSECASQVCAKDGSGAALGVPRGSCVPLDSVLFVDQSLCQSSGPIFCTPKQALDHVDAKHRYIVFRKSAVAADFAALSIGNNVAQQGIPIHLIGPLADEPPTAFAQPPSVMLGSQPTRDAITVQRSQVTVEGLYINGSQTGVNCLGSDASVRVVRSVLTGNRTALYAGSGCPITVDGVWLGRGPSGSFFAADTGNGRSLEVSNSDFAVQNSVFSDNGDMRTDGFGGIRVRSLGPQPTTRSTIVNSTFFQQTGLLKMGRYYTGIFCDTATSDRLVVLNSLFLTEQALLTSPEEHYIDPVCGSQLHHLASNDPLLSENKSVVLPMKAQIFRDAAGRDFHLGTAAETSLDRVRTGGTSSITVGTDRILAPGLDFDGLPRGAGTGEGMATPVAIGAYAPTR